MFKELNRTISKIVDESVKSSCVKLLGAIDTKTIELSAASKETAADFDAGKDVKMAETTTESIGGKDSSKKKSKKKKKKKKR